MEERSWWLRMEMINKSMLEADKILDEINSQDDIISLEKVEKHIENKFQIKINTFRIKFPSEIEDCGAIIKMEKNENGRVANIIINTSHDIPFQRFSLAHELGHLVNSIDSLEYGKPIMSTHISYDLNYITKEDYENDENLKNEQIANVFAIELLMPLNKFAKATQECSSINELALRFGVSIQAAISRIKMIRAYGK